MGGVDVEPHPIADGPGLQGGRADLEGGAAGFWGDEVVPVFAEIGPLRDGAAELPGGAGRGRFGGHDDGLRADGEAGD